MVEEAPVRMEQEREAVLREVWIVHMQLDLLLVRPLLADPQLMGLAGRLQLVINGRGLDLQRFMDLLPEQEEFTRGAASTRRLLLMRTPIAGRKTVSDVGMTMPELLRRCFAGGAF